MRRLALFSFYSRSGIAGSYACYYLEQLSKIAETVCIVNGSLFPGGREKLEKSGCTVFCRENKGFDFGAWKEFLLSKDSAFFRKYDELILCNSSCYGPVYPFETLFAEMESRRCDFWGLYRHPGLKDRKHNIPPHIQSYFLVLKKKLFLDGCFREYFDKLSCAASWDDAVKEETTFTAYFEGKGFVSASYLGSVFSEYIENPTVFMPKELLERKFPLVKRKCFTTEYSYINKISSSVQIKSLLSYIKGCTGYHVDYIYEDLLQTSENSHLIKALGLSYVLPGTGGSDEAGAGTIAAVLRSSLAERIPDNIRYLRYLPEGSSVFIVASSDEIMERWAKELTGLGNYRTEVRLQLGSEGCASAFLLTCRDVLRSYDYVCLLHDRECAPSDPPVRDRFFSEHCLSGVLFSKDYVRNIIRLFRSCGRLGILMPFVPMFAEWPQKLLNDEWGDCRKSALEIYAVLRLAVPFDEHPIVPWGGMFWLRGGAMEAFYRYGWTGHEQWTGDGCGENSLLRMYPMIAQESGFFSGCVCPQELAGSELSNLYFNLQKYSAVKIESGRVHFSDVRKVMGLYLQRKFPFIFGKRK